MKMKEHARYIRPDLIGISPFTRTARFLLNLHKGIYNLFSLCLTVERRPNRTRTALIILLIAIIIASVVLFTDLLARIYMIYEFSGDSHEDDFEQSIPFFMTCMLDQYATYIIFILYMIAISFLFSARNAYGQRHSRKVIGAFVLALTIPPLSIIFSFILIIFHTMNMGVVPAIGITTFLISILLGIYELTRKKTVISGCALGILSALPLLLITNQAYTMMRSTSRLREYSSIMVLVDVGLMGSMLLFIMAIRTALKYTKMYLPEDDRLQTRLLHQQAQQLRMEVEILRLQKEQMEVLEDIKADRIASSDIELLENKNEMEIPVEVESYTE